MNILMGYFEKYTWKSSTFVRQAIDSVDVLFNRSADGVDCSKIKR